MFELSVAFKYLLPRWRQLSVSIISMISILVIALVVWLIVVFFSVTNGLEKGWVQKLISLTAPVRILPTEAYYNSYYYQIDGISAASDYAYKSLSEKLNAQTTDPYDPTVDEEIPTSWPSPERQADGSVKDIIKLTYQTIESVKVVPKLTARDYEVTFANLRLRLIRNFNQNANANPSQASISHAIWLTSFDPQNPKINQVIQTLNPSDIQNFLNLLSISTENIREDQPETNVRIDRKTFQDRLQSFFANVNISELKVPNNGWKLPKNFLPAKAQFQACAVMRGNYMTRIIIPQQAEAVEDLHTSLDQAGFQNAIVKLMIKDGKLDATLPDGKNFSLSQSTPLIVDSSTLLKAQLDTTSIEAAKQLTQLEFDLKLTLQGVNLEGKSVLGNLEIAKAETKTLFQEAPLSPPLWLYHTDASHAKVSVLANDPAFGDGILLPKSFKDAGVLAGDRGYLSYYMPTTSALQEQRMPVYVAAFYDPGVIPIGGKLVLANPELTSLMRAAYQQEDKTLGTGINVHFDNTAKSEEVKNALQKGFKEAGIDKYWQIETYREYEFTKDIIQQLRSEKNLFTLLATVIIIVACSNIISMLIILVNDKKLEIGILRSMGATSTSIATIFGLCGIMMGLMGSLLGIGLAIVTLKNLPALIHFISRLQGYEMFNSTFYGDTIPHELSLEALVFVLISTALISLLAGIVPAVKASMLKPSAILRSE